MKINTRKENLITGNHWLNRDSYGGGGALPS
jgi:hypothetical protein